MFRNSIHICVLTALSAFGVQQAIAQTEEKKFEVGAQATVLRLPSRTFTGTGATVTFNEDSSSSWGFGGRLGYNFSRNLAIEGEVNFFPQDRVKDGGRKVQALFGAKVGQRFDKAGIFLKARPGFVRLSRGQYQFSGGCVTVFPPPIGCFQPVATTNFAFDIGGVAELYPSRNMIIRFDAGDTIVRFRSQREVAAANDSSAGFVILPAAPETKHNFQASIGVGIRF
jgi:hypothetical protein